MRRERGKHEKEVRKREWSGLRGGRGRKRGKREWGERGRGERERGGGRREANK